MKARVEELFHSVADLSAEARARYFTEHNVDDGTLKEVEALLVFDSPTNTSLEKDISQVAEGALARLEPKDTRCGPYRLGELLGRGGMGTVHLAERVDGEVAQRVAVKLLRPGADDPMLRQRFLAERQILATLSHPNIARLLDAGHSEDGQPYLVMEYVEGQPIDVWTTGLGIRHKITLFLKVCAAVGYLHRNLVVHRDLKPPNILVTCEDEPKLLDFGIAKMLDLSTASTMTGMHMLTPDYASPEQVNGGPVTTATDIYSLGAVLYKLLTGTCPHQFESNSAGAIASTINTGRITPPGNLVPELKGDLETILMKALRKEPQERYATIEQFSDDLQNYLESRPIRVRKGDAWYQTRKFLRRYWVSAAAAALVIASLSTGLYVANRQRLIAERRFGQLRHLSRRVLDLDAAIHALPGSTEARHRLVAASLEYLEGLSREAKGNLDLAQETADGYWRMARIQGVNAEYNLGDHAKAEESLKKADQLIETVLASRPGGRNALIRSAVIAQDRMILADTDGRRADALAHASKSVERLESFLSRHDSGNPVRFEGFVREGDARLAERAAAAGLYTNIALGYVNMHRYSEGARYARRADENSRDVPLTTDLRAQALSILANAQRYQGDLEGALSAIRQARRVSENATYGSETARFFNLYGLIFREGLILGEADAVNLDRPAEAIELFQKALDMTDEAARKDAHDSASRGRVGSSARELGKVLRNRDPRRALKALDLGIQRLEEAGKGPNTRRDLAALLGHSSYPLRTLGRPAEAKGRIDAALGILKDTKDYPSERVVLGSQAYWVVRALGDHEAETGNSRHALEIYENLLDQVMATHPDALTDLRDAPKLSRIYEALAVLYSRTGGAAKAAAMHSRRVDLWRHWQIELPNNPFVQRQLEAANEPIEERLISMR